MDAKANTHVCVSPMPDSETGTLLPTPLSAYLIVVAGPMPGTMFRIGEQSVSLGRSWESSFQLIDPSVSRRHACLTTDSTGCVSLTDQRSSNGTFVNGRRIPANRPTRLKDGDRVHLGPTVLLKLLRLDSTDERFQRELFERAVRDPLTGLFNRSYFLNRIGQLSEWSAAQRLRLAIVMLDIDHFKSINDRYGHLVGDCVLCELAVVIRETTRPEDVVARFGGDEFVIALPVATPNLATNLAERVRSNLALRRAIGGNAGLRVTASLGVAFCPSRRSTNLFDLIRAADQALYQAKSNGRNRVVFDDAGISETEMKTEAEISTFRSTP